MFKEFIYIYIPDTITFVTINVFINAITIDNGPTITSKIGMLIITLIDTITTIFTNVFTALIRIIVRT